MLTGIGRATLSTDSFAITTPVTTKSERHHGRMAFEVALMAKASLAKSCSGGRSGAWNALCSV